MTGLICREPLPTTMTAALLEDGGLRVVRDYPVPTPVAGEALLRMRLAGICGTDVALLRGYGGDDVRIPGHEFVAEVVAAHDPNWLDRRVVASINYVPGQPGVAAEHHPQRRVVGIRGHDGAFAEYLRVPEENLVAVAATVADEDAVFAEPLAAALRIGEQLDIGRRQPVAVVGPGRLGMLIGWVLREQGAAVRLLGRSAGSLELGRQWGLDGALVGAEPDNSQDLVIDASGSPAGVDESLRIVRPRGTLVLKSTWSALDGVAPDLAPVVVKELNVVGSRCGCVAQAMTWLARGVPFRSMVTGRYPLSQAAAAVRQAARPGARKVLLNGPG